MSKDNLVTQAGTEGRASPEWIQRLLAFAPVRLQRLRSIEMLHGMARRLGDRCGCQSKSRYEAPDEQARIWGLLVTADPPGMLRQNSICRLLNSSWLVWQPEPAGYSWAEALELQNVHSLISELFEGDLSPQRTLEEWEELGRNDFRFKVVTQDSVKPQAQVIAEQRVSVVTEILKKNPKFSHVNLSVSKNAPGSGGNEMAAAFLNAGLTIEFLRERILPRWHCGDMAIQVFTTYTVTRKDT